MPHIFRGQLILDGPKAARDDVAALRQELQAAGGDLAKIGQAAPKLGTIGEQAVAAKSPWAELAGSMDKARAAMAAMNKGGGKAAPAGAKSGADPTAQSKGVLERLRASISGETSKAAGQAASIGAKASSLVMAAAGVAGMMSLAKLAMGYRGMAQLQMLGMRTQLQMRQMFSGVNPAPAIRATDRFLNSLFSRGSVAGAAMSGLLTRGFNGFFAFLEKAQPYATAFFQGMILGALQAENTWLRLRLALLPVTEALGDAIGPMNGVKIAAAAGAITLGALALAAAGAAAPFIAAASAIAAVVAQIQALRSTTLPSWMEVKRKVRQDLGFTSQKETEDDADMQGRLAYQEAEGRRQAARGGAPGPVPAARSAVPQAAPGAAKPAGAATGQAYVDGVLQGVDAGKSAVEAAGGALATALDKGVRDKGKIQSPSKMARDTARNFPAGYAQGVDDGAGDVQAAADRSMVPTMGAPSAGSSSGGARGPAQVMINVTVSGDGSNKEEMRAVARATFGEEFRALALSLGVPVMLA